MVAWIYMGWLITLRAAALTSGALMGFVLNAPRWPGAQRIAWVDDDVRDIGTWNVVGDLFRTCNLLGVGEGVGRSLSLSLLVIL